VNPTEPPQVLVGTGIGFAVRRVMPTLGGGSAESTIQEIMKNKPQLPDSDSRADEIFFGGLLGTALAGIILVISYPALTTGRVFQ
jgi:hypothetical protein